MGMYRRNIRDELIERLDERINEIENMDAYPAFGLNSYVEGMKETKEIIDRALLEKDEE